MGLRKIVLGASVLLALAPLMPATAQTNPLGASSGQMVARGCVMTYQLTPKPTGEVEIAGEVACNNDAVYEEVSVTILDNGLPIDDGRLSGEPGCGYSQGAQTVGCRFTAERGHLYTAQYEFYLDGVESNRTPYPNDPFNGGVCQSNFFTQTEIPHLSCDARLHYLSR